MYRPLYFTLRKSSWGTGNQMIEDGSSPPAPHPEPFSVPWGEAFLARKANCNHGIHFISHHLGITYLFRTKLQSTYGKRYQLLIPVFCISSLSHALD
jgi:hypothetical protein